MAVNIEIVPFHTTPLPPFPLFIAHHYIWYAFRCVGSLHPLQAIATLRRIKRVLFRLNLLKVLPFSPPYSYPPARTLLLNEGLVIQAKPEPGSPWRGPGSLSGGQVALVGLALNLATQAVRPAPLYLMDEVQGAADREITWV